MFTRVGDVCARARARSKKVAPRHALLVALPVPDVARHECGPKTGPAKFRTCYLDYLDIFFFRDTNPRFCALEALFLSLSLLISLSLTLALKIAFRRRVYTSSG